VGIVEKQFKNGQSGEVEVLQTKVVLLEVQIELLRERAKIKTPK
jgi:outer membrane protein TolC